MQVGVIIHGPKPQQGTKTAPNASAAQLQTTSPTIKATRGVIVQALAANSAYVYVGGVGVTTDGVQLAAGQSVMLPVDDPSLIYVYGSTSSQVVNYVWV